MIPAALIRAKFTQGRTSTASRAKTSSNPSISMMRRVRGTSEKRLLRAEGDSKGAFQI